ncbi:MAG: hypothetical protein IJ196_07890 [Prevotella sp.]|nr:hypothetical protein [Prevotella sp.]
MTRRTILAVAALAFSLQSWAQQAELLNPNVVFLNDSAQVAALYGEWNQYVSEHPDDENGWRNLYFAYERYLMILIPARISSTGSDYLTQHISLSKEMNVLGRMEQAIPDTYTFNWCAYQGNYASVLYSGQNGEDIEQHAIHYMDRAIELLPENAQNFDYETCARYLACRQDQARLTDVLRKYYQSGRFSSSRLHYDFNELQGMDPGGVYLGSQEGHIFGKLIIQLVMGLHQDKILYCENFAMVPSYLKDIFRRIGLSEEFFASDGAYQKEWEQSKKYELIVRQIFSQSKRPVYVSGSDFAGLLLGHGLPEDLRNCLYNEGLTLRYSATPYNNMQVKRRNVEERYLLDYLRMSFSPQDEQNETASLYEPAFISSFNTAILLSDLLPYYKKHDSLRFRWLNSICNSILRRITDSGTGGIFGANRGFTIDKVEEGGTHYAVRVTGKPFFDPSDSNESLAEGRTKTILITEPEQ